jgi:hypothetical protein
MPKSLLKSVPELGIAAGFVCRSAVGCSALKSWAEKRASGAML